MKIVAWNLGHQTHELPLNDGFYAAIKGLAPDVLILNEYVHGPSLPPMVARLAEPELELAHVEVSERLGKNNQVLIASKVKLRPGDLRGPTITDAAASQFLHVRLEACPLEIVGLRVPYDEPNFAAYWEALREIVVATASRPILYIGDLNADPANPKSVGGRMLAWFKEQGWTMPSPSGPWSYMSHKGNITRIDHVFAGRGVQCTDVCYKTESAGVVLAGPNGSGV